MEMHTLKSKFNGTAFARKRQCRSAKRIDRSANPAFSHGTGLGLTVQSAPLPSDSSQYLQSCTSSPLSPITNYEFLTEYGSRVRTGRKWGWNSPVLQLGVKVRPVLLPFRLPAGNGYGATWLSGLPGAGHSQHSHVSIYRTILKDTVPYGIIEKSTDR